MESVDSAIIPLPTRSEPYLTSRVALTVFDRPSVVPFIATTFPALLRTSMKRIIRSLLKPVRSVSTWSWLKVKRGVAMFAANRSPNRAACSSSRASSDRRSSCPLMNVVTEEIAIRVITITMVNRAVRRVCQSAPNRLVKNGFMIDNSGRRLTDRNRPLGTDYFATFRGSHEINEPLGESLRIASSHHALFSDKAILVASYCIRVGIYPVD